jgi:hypothetical protein
MIVVDILIYYTPYINQSIFVSFILNVVIKVCKICFLNVILQILILGILLCCILCINQFVFVVFILGVVPKYA